VAARNLAHATAQLVRTAAYVASQHDGGDKQKAQSSCAPMGYATPSTSVYNRINDSILRNDTDCQRIDVELARICGIGFKQYALLQRWIVLHQLSHDTGKQGFTFDELSTACRQLGVKGCETYTRRIIRKGIGFYWNYDPRTDTIYPASYLTLCKRAIQHAYDHNLHDLYLYGNHPGQRRDMYISASGSGADFEGAILSAWYGAHGCPTIARSTLETLLYRDSRSIRRMERRACIRITSNEAQTTDPAAVPLKADGSLRGDVTHNAGVWSYRLPNTYSARMTRQHHKRGQGRKANCWFKHWLEQAQLPGRPQAKVAYNLRDLGKLNSVSRTYCETDKALKSSRKRGVSRTLYVATMRQRRGRVWKVDAIFEDI
jgi:hypothetical protein